MTASRKLISVLMIVENYYPMDIRVRREADSLSEKYSVTVLAIKHKGASFFEMINGVRVFRVPQFPEIQPRKIGYVLEYLYLTLISCLFFVVTFPIYRYKVVHTHNPPDTLFVVGIMARLLGRRFVFDHHDLAPELYLSRFSGREDVVYRTLLFLERLSYRFADVVITANRSYKDIAVNRHGIIPAKVHVVRNDPLLGEFEKAVAINASQDDDFLSVVFVGSINPQDGVLDLLDIFEEFLIRKPQRKVRLLIVGGGDSLNSVRQAATQKGLSEYITFTGTIHDRGRLLHLLSTADIGVEPAPENPLNTYSTFIKIMEYMATGLPVVAYDFPETRYSLGEGGFLVEPGNQGQFADFLVRLVEDPKLRRQLGNAGRRRISTGQNWDSSKSSLLKAYSKL